MEKLKASPTTEAKRLLEHYSKGETYRLVSEDILTAFPTRTVPIEHLFRENWKTVTQMGNMRSVFSVDTLTDGTHPNIVVKSPEEIFTKEETFLSKGLPWWGGPRSKERKIHLVNDTLILEQSIWEAVILSELNRNGIRAEIPQALIRTNNGKVGLIVNEIDILHSHQKRFQSQYTTDVCPNLRDIVQKTGIIPADDWTGQNTPKDNDGNTWIIDVNRWTWPPYTDKFYEQMIQTIRDTKS